MQHQTMLLAWYPHRYSQKSPAGCFDCGVVKRLEQNNLSLSFSSLKLTETGGTKQRECHAINQLPSRHPQYGSHLVVYSHLRDTARWAFADYIRLSNNLSKQMWLLWLRKKPKICRLCVPFKEFLNHIFSSANAGGSGRETTNRQSEELSTPSAAPASLPNQFKQRPPMYNASTASPTAPTSPTTPTSTPTNNAPPSAATAAQQDMPTQSPTTAPTPAPPQTQPKKNLSLTVRTSLIHSYYHTLVS